MLGNGPDMWKTLQHVQSKRKIPTAGQQCPNVSRTSAVACCRNKSHSAPEEHMHHVWLLICLCCLEASSRPVLCFCWLFFKKSFSKPPHLLWPRPRPQKEWGIQLRLKKAVKRNSGSTRRGPISSSPLCSAKPWWSAGPVWICLWELELDCGESLAWRKNCHLFHPLINLSELVCLRVIITCFSLWALSEVSYTLLVPEEERAAQISILNFSDFPPAAFRQPEKCRRESATLKNKNLFAGVGNKKKNNPMLLMVVKWCRILSLSFRFTSQCHSTRYVQFVPSLLSLWSNQSSPI